MEFDFVLFFGTTITAAILQGMFHLLTLHYFPNLNKIPRYTIGTLNMLLPYSFTLAIWSEWAALGLLWLVVGASGATVIGMNWLGEKFNNVRDDLDDLARRKTVDKKALDILDKWDAKAKESE